MDQPSNLFKSSEKSILKSLVEVYKRNHEQAVYEQDLPKHLDWVLQNLHKSAFIIVLVDSSSEYV